VHFNLYKNTVFSAVGLGYVANRKLSSGGNYNTPDASRFSLSSLPDNGMIESTYGATYKLLISMVEDKG
jgi:hypothetical protein